MFDSLKDKLGSFRKDVEETTEEKAEEEAEAAEAEAEATDAEADAQATAEADATAETAPTETESVESQPETVEADSTDSASTASTPTASAESESTDSESSGSKSIVSDQSEVGDEESSSSSGGFGKKLTSFAKGQIVIEEQDLEDPLWQLEMALLESDVEMNVTKEILSNIREDLAGATRSFSDETGDVVQQALHDSLLSVISVGQFDFEQRIAEADKPVTIIFTGVNGVGKTTSIAKLSQYLERKGFSSVMANGDTYRAGANEQIREHAENLDTKLIAHEQGGDPAAVIYDAVEYAESNDVDVVLGDTAGRLHTSDDLMEQLEKIERVVGPDMTVFVDEAVAGQDAVQRAKQFNDAAEIDGAILTKADADSQGGAAISIAHVTGKPILFLGTGQGYDHIEPFVPEELVSDLLGEEE